MTTEYTASVRVEDGQLTVSRPHPSVGPVDDLLDSLVYTVRDDSTVVAIELHVEFAQTTEEPTLPPIDPDTPSPNLPPVPDPLGTSTGA